MTLLGQDVLTRSAKRNKPLRAWLESWVTDVVNAEWHAIGDVRKMYPAADGVPLTSRTVVTVFNVKGNDFRLLTWIDYMAGIVQVLDVMTHAEYSKDLWKMRY